MSRSHETLYQTFRYLLPPIYIIYIIYQQNVEKKRTITGSRLLGRNAFYYIGCIVLLCLFCLSFVHGFFSRIQLYAVSPRRFTDFLSSPFPAVLMRADRLTHCRRRGRAYVPNTLHYTLLCTFAVRNNIVKEKRDHHHLHHAASSLCVPRRQLVSAIIFSSSF